MYEPSPEKIEQYACHHTQEENSVLAELNRETWAKVLIPRMLSCIMLDKTIIHNLMILVMILANKTTRFGTISVPLELRIYFEGQEIDSYETFFNAFNLSYQANEHLKTDLILTAFQTYESETFDILGQYWLYELENDLGSENYDHVTQTNKYYDKFHSSTDPAEYDTGRMHPDIIIYLIDDKENLKPIRKLKPPDYNNPYKID